MKGMRKNAWLLGLLAVLAVSVFVMLRSRAPVEKNTAPQMLAASAHTEAAFAAIRAERLARDLPIDLSDDPNDTGLIGWPYSPITTTLGSLESKRSTYNPNVAAMMVEMFDALDLDTDDRIAINLSSSFPALNVAVLCAAETLGIRYTAIFSVGASTYGANIPAFTYGDMEHALTEQGILSQGSDGFSIGGMDDMGLEMPEDVKADIIQRLQALGYAHFACTSLDEGIAQRAAYYDANGTIRCFVNVGGNDISFGKGSGMQSANGGILTTLPAGEGGTGLIQYYLRQGIPVIHLLNMKDLLPAYGLPYDPIPLPAVGKGDVYTMQRRNPLVYYGLAAVDLLALAVVIRGERRHRGPGGTSGAGPASSRSPCGRNG